jgi:ribosomal protein S18 acetylase RimI-like enzyme
VIRVRRASAEDLPALAAVVARAFRHDPILRWTFPGRGREDRLRRFFEAFDRRTVELGWLWAAGLAAAAAWVPPGSDAAYADIEETIHPEMVALCGDGASRYGPFWAWVEAKRPAEPHWYLDHIAVDPERQGSGLGLALLRHGMGLAAADRKPAFLVTASRHNADFYARRGFEVVDAAVPPDGGPRVWFMRRDP